MTAEEQRLEESRERQNNWKRWGPYLSERAWGTVREDYSPDGSVWEYFPHDHARSRAYRWNEDGIAGICDRHQSICFAIALWNEQDPILKERLFGLSGNEGNHGEDVKECYFYLDSTPTHSYMKFLYKYPQRAFPYLQLLEENRRRTRQDREFELVDTGVFADDRYFDIFVEYAKASSNDILIRVTAVNRARRRRTAPSAADDLVSQHVVLGTRDVSPGAAAGRQHAGRRAHARRAGSLHAALRGHARFALHRERHEPQTDLRHRRRALVLEGRHQRLRRARSEGGGQPGTARNEGGRSLHGSSSEPASRRSSGYDSRTGSSLRERTASATTSIASLPRGSEKPTSSTRP